MTFLTAGYANGAECTRTVNGLRQARPYLYQIEKNGKVSYLLGSMHAGIPLETFPDKIEQLAKSAKNLAFESDPDDAKTERFQAAMDAVTFYPAGESLENHLSPAAIAHLQTLFPNVNRESLIRYRPWVIAAGIDNDALNAMQKKEASNWQWSDGLDHTLIRQAKADGKSFVSLDDINQKPMEFKEGTTGADLERLLAFPDPYGHAIDCARLARSIYLNGNGEEEFEKYMQACEPPKFIETVHRRTSQWVPKIESMLKEGSAFIVVGAGHVTGPHGLIEILSKKGYRVQRVPFENCSPSVSTTGSGQLAPTGVFKDGRR